MANKMTTQTDRSMLRSLSTSAVVILCLGLIACSGGCSGGAPSSNSPSTQPSAQPPEPPVAIKVYPGPDGCAENNFTSDIFALGSINNQNQWYSDPNLNADQSIEKLGAAAKRGKGVWRISNKVYRGDFDFQPQSPILPLSAGESTVRSPGGGDTICTSFFIRTVSNVADESAVTFSHSPAGPSDRHEYVRFVNDDDSRKGFRIWGSDTKNSTASFTFRDFDFQTSIPRAEWKHVVVITTSPDGPGNDTVNVYVDGALKGTMSTWEDWRYANAILPGNVPPAYAPPSLSRGMFRLSTRCASLTREGYDCPSRNSGVDGPLGFYIDDFVQITYNAASPTAILSQYKTGFELP